MTVYDPLLVNFIYYFYTKNPRRSIVLNNMKCHDMPHKYLFIFLNNHEIK